MFAREQRFWIGGMTLETKLFKVKNSLMQYLIKAWIFSKGLWSIGYFLVIYTSGMHAMNAFASLLIYTAYLAFAA